MPAGLSLDPNTGVISGNPGTTGFYGITIVAVDDAGSKVYSGFFLTVSLDPSINYPPIALNGGAIVPPQTATVGVAYSVETSVGFSDPEGRPMTYISSPLPAGLTLNPATGQISGIPTQPGQFGITVGATDDGGTTVYNGFFLTINAGSPRIGAKEIGSGLNVSVLGNPVAGETVNVEIRGALNQPITLKTLGSAATQSIQLRLNRLAKQKPLLFA
ncbi:hypothetical protein GO730_11605 [Spirosoma sp. HMF3257]|uniref:Dystroglycan-type cadherin-like domain-containing protein n=1 Tax=Spirosoma telluris TaxID=2183553 RepID=A0A327NLD1_9BACT|nr:hypothetical protein [Spirosoma telluris]RAI74734.1 hypothetical protein HMF3257_11515 [Spirosoma telluris]